jgi:serine protease Do
MPSDFGEVAEKLRRSTVHVRGADPREGGGSGVIWRPDGLIVTNAHVARLDRLVVELWDGRRYDAQLEKRDPRRDLAVLRVPVRDAPAVRAGDSSAARPGQIVLAVGNPLGFLGALSTGVIYGHGPLRGVGRQTWLQADIRLAPGNSGGPLADADGRVLGINTMIAGGLALAVPSNAVVSFLAETRSRPSLGVTLRPIREGLLLLEVSPNSAAARASLLPGDILVGFDSPDDLHDAIERDDLLVLNFTRGDRTAVRHVAIRLREAEAA